MSKLQSVRCGLHPYPALCSVLGKRGDATACLIEHSSCFSSINTEPETISSDSRELCSPQGLILEPFANTKVAVFLKTLHH